jgi:4-hydroxy-tetrahydrodipicolinate synthase
MDDVIRGLFVAAATPLDPAGAVDQEALVRHCQGLLAGGCDGVALFGITGEGPSFASRERLAAVEALLQAGIPAARIVLGTGCPAIPETVRLTREALALGLRHALILPPYFFRDVAEQGIEDAFAAIIDGVASDRLRATLHHIPALCGVGVTAAALGRLRARYGRLLAGVHDSSGDLAGLRAFRQAAPECACLVGAESEIARARALGATGSIGAMANLVPGLVRAMFAGPPGQDHSGDEAALRKACALLDGMAFIPALKSVLAARSGDGAWRAVRPPLRPADAAAGARIAAALTAIEARRAA